MHRILLVRLRLIGDVVFTTPAVTAIRQHFPTAHLAYVVEPVAAAVVQGNPHLDEVIVAGAPSGGVAQFLGDLRLGRRLRRERYDIAVDFHGGPRSSLLTWLSRAPVRIGYDIPARAWMYTHRVVRPRGLRPRHSVENQWDLLESLGIARPDRERFPVEMVADEASIRMVDERLTRAGVTAGHQVIVIHVSAGNPFRRWPAGAFSTLVEQLAAAAADRRLIVTAGPSERSVRDAIISSARAALGPSRQDRVVACDEFSIGELRALLDRAALYIGGDSGPLHVAACTSVPIVALYGPTLPVRSEPWRPANQIAEAIEIRDLSCRPCDQRVCVPGDFRCLTQVRPEQVLEAAERALARAAQTGPG